MVATTSIVILYVDNILILTSSTAELQAYSVCSMTWLDLSIHVVVVVVDVVQF